MKTAQSITFRIVFSFQTTYFQSWKRYFFKNLSNSPFQCRSWTLGKRNSDRKEVAVLENEYRRDKWQVLPASIIQTQADVPVSQLAGHKTPSFPALRERHFLWLLGHFRSQIHLSLGAKVYLSFSLYYRWRPGWAEHLSCPVWITTAHCLAPVSSNTCFVSSIF